MCRTRTSFQTVLTWFQIRHTVDLYTPYLDESGVLDRFGGFPSVPFASKLLKMVDISSFLGCFKYENDN